MINLQIERSERDRRGPQDVAGRAATQSSNVSQTTNHVRPRSAAAAAAIGVDRRPDVKH